MLVSEKVLKTAMTTVLLKESLLEKKMAKMLATMTDDHLVFLKALYWAFEIPHMLGTSMVCLRYFGSLVYISQALPL